MFVKSLGQGFALGVRRLRQDDAALAAGEGRVHCCGIVGYAGHQDASKILCNGVDLLQNRGYDSCGISTMSKKKIFTTKFASRGSTSDSVDLLKQHAPLKHTGHNIGIAHTRWATHGAKTDENAHPHSDWKGRISLVHNGTIDNFDDLKSELVKAGIPFKSETDTEVIANMIGRYLDQGQSFQQAVKSAVSRLRGTWGLLILHRDHPNGFMVARNGSPLILGSSGGEVFVASEPLALAEHTNEYLALNDGDICYVSNTGLDHLRSGRDARAIPTQNLETEPTPFKHWTVKEIYEQPQSLGRALNFGGRLNAIGPKSVKLRGLDDNEKNLSKINHLVITGCGTSFYAGMFGQLLMRHIGCFNSVDLVDSSEVDSCTFSRNAAECGILALSQSGETRDVVQALEQADALKIKKMSIVNAVGSLVARMTSCGVYLNAGREVAVASTKAFTSQVAVLGLVAIWFAQKKNVDNDTVVGAVADAIHRLPVVASQALACDSQMRKLATKLLDTKSMFVLGKGFAFPVALEGALKIKEISYIHAEGFGGGQLKHGPFALLDEKAKTPVVLIILKDAHQPAMINAAQQVKARGARLIAITDDPSCVKQLTEDVVEIPKNGPLTALGATIPLQLLAYHLATLRGVNPDKPRGLAKTVTVM
eukprot:Gregarina_sp_Pseudo_9__4958@NODE_519_length_2654_cov_23_733461_g490_i0_p1_GENE_NODE_519_length_2654_cov_23_733461_g490_i0NODE_519_length_2654_cov_23_733461_g490_i0_p1_ORF_typecomplete_len650_score193_40SIS/PF01380_22/1_5e23SIS/PF01380_22/1_1e28GATase_6/PF13522_6/2_9e41GATase_6/PF13522_6/3_2e03GATase_7/PF13537_6/1_8e18GATase_4/PF13230_6/7_8e13bactPGI_C/PF10432_9/3_3e02bactPGI_C/PF10432_9/4_6e05SIS_2/PF13580_6/9_7e03SIS_2/PF13580_6/0_9SIS_2/PF13580_6/0_18Hydrolase/PF00702_26/0_4_NODE_519_length_26